MADIRINALPDGDATFTNTATLPYEDPNDESNKTKRVTISELAQSNVEAYSETRTYKVGDVARFLEAENFICVVAVTTPETFDKAKWEPVRANLETSVIVTKLLGPVAIASIQGDGADTITVNFVDSIATFFQINDLVSVAGTGSYDTIPPSAITDVIDLNTIEINITGNTNTNIVNAGTFFNNSAIIVNATKGFIVNNSAANAEQPSVDVVDEAQQRVVFSNFTVEGNFVLMDAAGAVTAIPASTATSNDKTGNLLLGSVGGIVSSSTIFSVRTQPIQIYQPSITEKFNEFAAGGKISPGGLLTLGLGTTLTINISANTTYFPGIGYEVDPNEPDTITNANDTNPIPVGAFVKVIRTGTTQDDFSIDVTGNELDVDNFNENGTTLAAIPSTGPQFQIFRVYAAASGGPISTAIVYYGETLYESIDEARSRLDNDTFVEKFISRPTAFRGFIITKSGLVNYNAGTENVDFVLIAKPEEYSLDRGNPQNRSLGLTQQQLQADIANESTGSIDEGVITLNSETISTIQGDLGPDPDIVTVVLDSAPSWVAGEFVRILGTVNYDEDYEIQSVSSTTVVLIATIPPSTTLETVGTALSLNRIDIAAGDGQILDHSVPNGFFRTQVTWSDELDILLSPTQLNNQTIYILKDTDGVTSFLTLNDSTINSAQIRNDILLGVIYTKVGLTSPDNERIWALQNQRIAISAPRSQLDDFTDFLFRTVTGADTTEADPSVDYSMGRNTGRIIGRSLNFSNSNEDPNVLAVPAKTSIEFLRMTRDGFIDGTTLETIPDFAQFDNNGTLMAVSSNNFQVMRLWCEPESDQYTLQYGTDTYSQTQIEGTNYINENPPNPPGLTNSAYVISSLIIANLTGGGNDNWDSNVEQRILAGDITGGTTQGGAGGGAVSDTPWSEDHDGGTGGAGRFGGAGGASADSRPFFAGRYPFVHSCGHPR